eukprot:360375-Chlamydomonas_euryale.AAC.2
MRRTPSGCPHPQPHTPHPTLPYSPVRPFVVATGAPASPPSPTAPRCSARAIPLPRIPLQRRSPPPLLSPRPSPQVTIQNRPTVLNTGEYSGELRWDESRAGRDLHIISGLTVTKMSNDGGDYATVLGSLQLSSGQHVWNVYINHVEDSNLFIGVSVGGHDLNADPQEMRHRTYYLSNGCGAARACSGGCFEDRALSRASAAAAGERRGRAPMPSGAQGSGSNALRSAGAGLRCLLACRGRAPMPSGAQGPGSDAFRSAGTGLRCLRERRGRAPMPSGAQGPGSDGSWGAGVKWALGIRCTELRPPPFLHPRPAALCLSPPGSRSAGPSASPASW